MLTAVLDDIGSYGAGYSNWGTLLIWFTKPFYEVAIVGKTVNEKMSSLQKHYLPNVIFAGSSIESSLPLLKNRFIENETMIYVCKDKACLLQVKEPKDALKQMAF